MPLISPTAEYALRAMVAIAHSQGAAVVTQTIARMTQVPPGYLPKVLQILRKAGLVDSKRGLGGGFTLARPADQTTVLDVVHAVDPVRRIERCPLGIASHGTTLCPLHRRLDEAFGSVERAFASTTLAELVGAPDGAPLCQTLPVTLTMPLGTDR